MRAHICSTGLSSRLWEAIPEGPQLHVAAVTESSSLTYESQHYLEDALYHHSLEEGPFIKPPDGSPGCTHSQAITSLQDDEVTPPTLFIFETPFCAGSSMAMDLKCQSLKS